MISKHEFQKNNFSLFYSYWDNLEDIKLLSPHDFKKVRQKVRSAIIQVLTKGMEDTLIGKTLVRRVLSASEIKFEIQKIIGFEVKKANVYFHLQVLEEIEAIQIVGNITSNKKITAYYGKTAKAFLLTGKTEKEELSLLRDQKFLNFLISINPEISKSEIRKVLNGISKIGDHDTSMFVNWMDEHGEHMRDQEVDFIEFYKLITFLKIENPEVKEAVSKLSKLLRFE
ncbi:MAG: hypothetical protein ACW99A_02015 [Candidatus Kariarchaeaceae archaeon]|jgi:hypothetical protein